MCFTVLYSYSYTLEFAKLPGVLESHFEDVNEQVTNEENTIS